MTWEELRKSVNYSNNFSYVSYKSMLIQ